MFTIINAEKIDEIEMIRCLFREYEEFLNVDLCFQDFEEELETLPGKYTLPKGRLLLALTNKQAAGCVALKKIDEETCEMKRLFVRPEHRKNRLGQALAKRIIEEAQQIGYSQMRLDTLKQLEAALTLYKSLGFEETTAYYHNPLPDAIYMELKLNNPHL